MAIQRSDGSWYDEPAVASKARGAFPQGSVLDEKVILFLARIPQVIDRIRKGQRQTSFADCRCSP
jgi:hypothetical protein